MDSILSAVAWSDLFVPFHTLTEIVVRGTLMYLGLLILLRSVLKRQSGGLSITDVLLVVLIADAAQNGMAGEYRSITEGLMLVATILFWNYLVDWLGYKVPAIGRFMHPPPLLLVDHGKILRRNLRQELITVDELMSALREQGIENLNQVRRAHLEGDGTISVSKA